MLLRNWIELGILIAVVVTGAVSKYMVHKKVRQLDGCHGINENGPGHGWKMR